MTKKTQGVSKRWSKSRWVAIGTGVVVTLLLVLLALNLATGEKHVKQELARLYTVHDAQFQRTMGMMLGPAIVGGNRFAALENGDEIFPAMLAALRSARKSITLETYIYWSGEIGKQFAAVMAERARAGVKVHLLVDWLGSNKMDPDMVKDMEAAGVVVMRYHPLHWYTLERFNNRTHRKILVVDGSIGFTGGVGIADEWQGHAQDPDHWRDSHFRVEGPVVAQMQAAFMDNWMKVTGEVLHGPDYFPALESIDAGGAAQMFMSSPSGGSESMKLMYLLVITAAEHTIHLSSAYFVPDKLTMDALVAAARRGVKVQIITPGAHTDQKTVALASRAHWDELLEAGVELYQYEPTMYHCKMMVADDLFVSVGSTNFDPRSFGLNDEANLNIYDADFARSQAEVFRADLAQAHRLTLDEWRDRPLRERLGERMASLLGRAL